MMYLECAKPEMALTIVYAMAQALFRDYGEFCAPARNPDDVVKALDIVAGFIAERVMEKETCENT